MTTENEHYQAAIDLSVSNLGKGLMQLVLQEVRALPDVWQRMPEYQQNEVIERIRTNVEYHTMQAVKLIASQGCKRVVGELEKITLSEKNQAVIRISSNNESEALHELFESTKQMVMIVLASPDQFTGGMHEVKGDPDQNEIELDPDEEPNSKLLDIDYD